MCLCHSFVPDELINTTVVPLLKNKSGDLTDVNNYRAIALSNCLSKILEILMLVFKHLTCVMSFTDLVFRRSTLQVWAAVS